MGQAIGDYLPAAVGIAISPLPIIASVLILVSASWAREQPRVPRGLARRPLGAGAILLLVAGSAAANDDGQPAGWVSWLKLLLGLGLLFLAFEQFRARPRGDAEPVTPGWMGAIDSFTPPKAAGAGVALAAVNPKNLILLVAGMAAIAQTGISGR